MRWPSGAHEMGLATLATNNLGVPPETARQISMVLDSPRTKSTDVPSGVNVAPKSATPRSGGTIRTLFVVAV